MLVCVLLDDVADEVPVLDPVLVLDCEAEAESVEEESVDDGSEDVAESVGVEDASVDLSSPESESESVAVSEALEAATVYVKPPKEVTDPEEASVI